MKFDQAEVRPGSPVKLTVKGAPSSRIAVAAIDKSIHFLAQGNDVKVKEVSKIRLKYLSKTRCQSQNFKLISMSFYTLAKNQGFYTPTTGWSSRRTNLIITNPDESKFQMEKFIKAKKSPNVTDQHFLRYFVTSNDDSFTFIVHSWLGSERSQPSVLVMSQTEVDVQVQDIIMEVRRISWIQRRRSL